MTHAQLVLDVAGATGESAVTIKRRGFGLMATHSADLEPENLCLVLDCPFCGHPVAYPGAVSDGAQALAECLLCDVYFDFALEEVYATESEDRGQVMSRVA